MEWVSWIVVGLIAGWFAGRIMRGSGYGIKGDIIIGALGGLLGGWMAVTLLHIGAGLNGINLVSMLAALVGSAILLILLRVLGGDLKGILR